MRVGTLCEPKTSGFRGDSPVREPPWTAVASNLRSNCTIRHSPSFVGAQRIRHTEAVRKIFEPLDSGASADAVALPRCYRRSSSPARSDSDAGPERSSASRF